MPLSTVIHESPVRVRYAETDAAGIAHHSSFIPWLETGRVEWMRAAGASYADLEADGYTLPVIELNIKYVAAARFDDLLTVRTALTDVRSRTVTFLYEIVTSEEHPRQLANGTTRHVCVRGDKIAPLPDVLRRIVSAHSQTRA